MSILKDIKTAIKTAEARYDGWWAASTGLGGTARRAAWQPECLVSPEEAFSLYHNNDLARTIIEAPVEAALRQGWHVETGDADADKLWRAKVEALNLDELLTKALVYGRTCGGGGLILGLAGSGEDMSQPSPKGGELRNLTPWDRRQATITKHVTDPNSPSYGLPELVQLQLAGRASLTLVHRDRLVLFGGARTGEQERQINNWWDYSVLQPVKSVLEEMGLGWASASLLLQTASQPVYGVKDLAAILASAEGEERLSARFKIIAMMRSVAKAMVIDADGESYTNVSQSFGGVPELLDRLATRVAAAGRIPVTILMGEAPAGLNATGQSDLETWYAQARTMQALVIQPAIQRLVGLMGGGEAEVCMHDPDPNHASKQAQLAAVRAQADTAYVTAGVFLPSEIATARTSGEEPYIHIEAREEAPAEGVDPMQEQADIQSTVLNGAQVTSLVEIVTQVAAGTLPRDSASAIIQLAYQVDKTQAEAMLGSAGTDAFTPTPKTPAPDRGLARDVRPAPAGDDKALEDDGPMGDSEPA